MSDFFHSAGISNLTCALYAISSQKTGNLDDPSGFSTETEKRRGRRMKPLEIQSLFAYDAFWTLRWSALWSQWHVQKLFASNSRRCDCFVLGCKRTALTWLGLRLSLIRGPFSGTSAVAEFCLEFKAFTSIRILLVGVRSCQPLWCKTHLLLVFFLVWSDYYYSSKHARSLQWELHKNGNNSFF